MVKAWVASGSDELQQDWWLRGSGVLGTGTKKRKEGTAETKEIRIEGELSLVEK